jgi:hypothetical protein
MIDTSTVLLVIAMHTPLDYLDTERNDVYTDFDTLDNVMQRLCWPDSRRLNRKCGSETAGHTAANKITD